VTRLPIDCRMCKTVNCWHSTDAHFNHIETAFVPPIIVRNDSYIHYWYPILRVYGLWFASRSFITSQILIGGYPCYLIERWRSPMPFPHFWLAIDSMSNNSLVFGKYSSTSSPFLIQLLHLDSHDVPTQCQISQLCARGLCGEVCSWVHGWMSYDGRRSDWFILSTDRYF
jgi:hypothetical protein